jgi:hypothetical protein
MKVKGLAVAALTFTVNTMGVAAPPQDPNAALYADPLLNAVLRFDTPAVEAQLKHGVSPDAKDAKNRSALFFAAQDGSTDIVRLLLQYGADVSVREKEHGETALSAAARRNHVETVRLLLAKDPGGAGAAAWNAVYQNNVGVLEAAMATDRLSPDDLSFLLEVAEREGSPEVAAHLRKAGASPPPTPGFATTPAILRGYLGRYIESGGLSEMAVSLSDGALYVSYGFQPIKLVAIDALRFIQEGVPGVRLTFDLESGRVVGVRVREVGLETRYEKVDAAKP